MNVWAKGAGRKSQKGGEASYQLLNMTFPGWAFGPQQGRHLCACLSSPSAPQARWLNYLQEGTGPRDSQHSLLQPAKASPSWAPVAWGLKPRHPAAVSTLPLALFDPPPAVPLYTHQSPPALGGKIMLASHLWAVHAGIRGFWSCGAIFVHSVLSSLLTNSNATFQ